MHELNRHGAFADGRGDALDRARPHIPCREHTSPAGSPAGCGLFEYGGPQPFGGAIHSVGNATE